MAVIQNYIVEDKEERDNSLDDSKRPKIIHEEKSSQGDSYQMLNASQTSLLRKEKLFTPILQQQKDRGVNGKNSGRASTKNLNEDTMQTQANVQNLPIIQKHQQVNPNISLNSSIQSNHLPVSIQTKTMPAQIEDLTTPVEQTSEPFTPMDTELITPIGELQGLNCEEWELSQQDLEQIAIIYDKIRHLFKYELQFTSQRSSVDQDQQLAQDFDEQLTEVMNTLNQKLQDSQI